MAKPLSQILAESFDTGDQKTHAKFFIRKINKSFYGRFKWNNGTQSFMRAGGKYPDRQSAVAAAKVSAL